MVKNTKVQKRISLTVYHALMLLFSLLMIYPLLWMLASSIKPNGEIFTKASSLLTDSPSFEHYTTGWRGFGGYTFGRFFSNSLLAALISALGMMLSSAVVAYGFARIKFKGRQFWFTAMIVTMMLPGQVMMIPRFVLFNEMGWVGTFLPMTVPAFFGSGFNIFLIMQFIRTIPYELDEAASIDGCSRYSSFLRIILPLIVPSLVTVSVLTFMGSWEDFMGALLYLNKPHMYTVAYALKRRFILGQNQFAEHGKTVRCCPVRQSAKGSFVCCTLHRLVRLRIALECCF